MIWVLSQWGSQRRNGLEIAQRQGRWVPRVIYVGENALSIEMKESSIFKGTFTFWSRT